LFVFQENQGENKIMPIDYSEYPPNWKSELVPAVRKRSGDKCECCGLENGQIVYSVRFKIQDSDGRYKYKQVWFRVKEDAERENRYPAPPKVVTVVLTVAHLDHDEENWDVDINRLMHMCQACHLRYDAKEKYRRAISK
jgi:hypothetical protein